MKIDFSQEYDQIKNKIIAVVYTFEKENASGFQHYDTWKSDVISCWLHAIQELRCIPYIMDVRTFVFKSMNNSLPPIDFIINLNAGNYDLSTLTLVPSVCGFLGLPCIPCDANTIIIGENKVISNLFAFVQKINIPKELDFSDINGIIKPINLGSSRGIIKGGSTLERNDQYICQEFIPGFDITTPVMYNPITKKLAVFPSVMYYPDSKDINWFFGANEKDKRQGYKRKIVTIDNETIKNLERLANLMSIKTYCRIDCRVKCENENEMEEYLTSVIPYNKINFIEMNPTPTIKSDNNFLTSMAGISAEFSHYHLLNWYQSYLQKSTLTGFILFCSLLYYLSEKVPNFPIVECLKD